MNFHQQEISKVLSSVTERDLTIESSGDLLILEKKRSNIEYVYWLFLIIGIPVYFMLNNFSVTGLIIVFALSICLVYLIYDSLLATNKLVVDLARKGLLVVSNNRVLRSTKVLPFNEVLDIVLTQKSFGRGQPAGRRLFIQTTDGRSVTALDFRNTATAEKIESVLNSVIKG